MFKKSVALDGRQRRKASLETLDEAAE